MNTLFAYFLGISALVLIAYIFTGPWRRKRKPQIPDHFHGKARAFYEKGVANYCKMIDDQRKENRREAISLWITVLPAWAGLVAVGILWPFGFRSWLSILIEVLFLILWTGLVYLFWVAARRWLGCKDNTRFPWECNTSGDREDRNG